MDWMNRYFTSWSEEHDTFVKENGSKIEKMEKVMNWSAEYDSKEKLEPNTRRVTYSGKQIPTTTFIEEF